MCSMKDTTTGLLKLGSELVSGGILKKYVGDLVDIKRKT